MKLTVSESTFRRIIAAVLLLGFAYGTFLWSEFVYNRAYESGIETGKNGYLITPDRRVSVWHRGIPDSTYRDGYLVVTKVDTILHADMVYQSTSGQTTMKSTVGAFPDSTFYFVGGYIAYNIRTYVDSVNCYDNVAESFIIDGHGVNGAILRIDMNGEDLYIP